MPAPPTRPTSPGTWTTRPRWRKAGRSPPGSSKAPAATWSKTGWTSPAPAGDSAVPRPSSGSAHFAATATSKTTGATTSPRNATASTNPATPATSFRTRREAPPEEPHPIALAISVLPAGPVAITQHRPAVRTAHQAGRRACIASDFVRKTIFEIPSHRAARLTRLEALDGVRSKDECGKAPTAGAEREVRDLRRGAHRTGDAAGGRGAVRSGSLDRGACVSDREAGGAGGAGRLGAGPAGGVAGVGRGGGDSSGGGAAAPAGPAPR